MKRTNGKLLPLYSSLPFLVLVSSAIMVSLITWACS